MTIHVSKAPHMRFSFDDVTVSEIRIRDINEANRETRDTRIIALPRGQYTDPHNLRETGLKMTINPAKFKDHMTPSSRFSNRVTFLHFSIKHWILESHSVIL